mmetsp:Transcript_24334/g.49590  ORF Transcript_24334/g.49590 Transcript_24334/m.49590 type:complete len:185 (-) Transcript_24334:855-1409(-)
MSAAIRLGFVLPTDEEIQASEASKSKCLEANDKNFWCDSREECLERDGNNGCRDEKHAQELRKFVRNNHESISIQGTNTSNITTWMDLARHHLGLGLSWTDSLPILCPGRENLRRFLEKSLKLEELVLPAFYATPLGKQEHERWFWDVMVGEKKAYCWVDIDRLFRNARSWDEIVYERMVTHEW